MTTEAKQRPPEEAEPEPQPDPPESIVDVEVIEAGSTALVERPSREVLMPMDPAQVVEGMKTYQKLLQELLDDSDWQDAGSDGRFPKKSAWRKIARAFNLSVTIVRLDVSRDAEGSPVRAECIARATAPNGQVSDADGYCAIAEFTGRRANDTKLENTLRATATTRAKNRAIADLVGMGEVSAEEIEAAGGQAGPPFGPAVDDESRVAASKALAYLLGPEAEGVWGQIKGVAGGYMPMLVAKSIVAIARTKRELEDAIEDAHSESLREEGRVDPGEAPAREAS